MSRDWKTPNNDARVYRANGLVRGYPSSRVSNMYTRNCLVDNISRCSRYIEYDTMRIVCMYVRGATQKQRDFLNDSQTISDIDTTIIKISSGHTYTST